MLRAKLQYWLWDVCLCADGGWRWLSDTCARSPFANTESNVQHFCCGETRDRKRKIIDSWRETKTEKKTKSTCTYLLRCASSADDEKPRKHFSPYWFWCEPNLPHIKCHCWFHCVWPNGRQSTTVTCAWIEKNRARELEPRFCPSASRGSINSINADGTLTCWVQSHHRIENYAKWKTNAGDRTNERTNKWKQIRRGIFPSIDIDARGRRWTKRRINRKCNNIYLFISVLHFGARFHCSIRFKWNLFAANVFVYRHTRCLWCIGI